MEACGVAVGFGEAPQARDLFEPSERNEPKISNMRRNLSAPMRKQAMESNRPDRWMEI